MTHAKILQSDRVYTFSRFFEMTVDPEELLAEFGYGLSKGKLVLPQGVADIDVEGLRSQLEEDLTYVDLSSEAARREILIAPILMRVCRSLKSKLKIEYNLNVSEFLRGSLDYYLQGAQNVVVIEAKQADLTRGFTQLAVELIALDQWTNSDAPLLYGAVTTGDIWRFGVLDRTMKRVTQDLNLFRVPEDLPTLLSSFVGILG
ncbi:MAG: hypothetical protein HC860_14585 [Alkalinema sp. RU_4_3]|nr:hypothetical protein [Alkalinema sp. RU_4_3]